MGKELGEKFLSNLGTILSGKLGKDRNEMTTGAGKSATDILSGTTIEGHRNDYNKPLFYVGNEFQAFEDDFNKFVGESAKLYGNPNDEFIHDMAGKLEDFVNRFIAFYGDIDQLKIKYSYIEDTLQRTITANFSILFQIVFGGNIDYKVVKVFRDKLNRVYTDENTPKEVKRMLAEFME